MDQDGSPEQKKPKLRPRDMGRMTPEEIAEFMATKRMNQEIIHAQAERRRKIPQGFLSTRIT